MTRFHTKALEIFERLRKAGTPMDICDLVVSNDEPALIDERRFFLHTKPKKSGTGLGYANLLIRLLDFRDALVAQDRVRIEDKSLEPSEVDPLDKKLVLCFLEKMVEEGSGGRSPQGLLHAIC